MNNFLVRLLKLSFRLTSHSHRSNFIKHASNIQAYTFMLPNFLLYSHQNATQGVGENSVWKRIWITYPGEFGPYLWRTRPTTLENSQDLHLYLTDGSRVPACSILVE